MVKRHHFLPKKTLFKGRIFKIIYLFFFINYFITILSCNTHSKKIQNNISVDSTDHFNKFSAKNIHVINLEKFEQRHPDIKLVTVVVDDPVYHKQKSYQGFRLKEILASNELIKTKKSSEIELIFTTKDGYAPIISYNKILALNPVIAIRDKWAMKEQRWEKFLHKGMLITPAPYYLVWENIPATDYSFPWPYQLTSIEVTLSDQVFKSIIPKDTLQALNGFNLFRENCIKCHSINLVGGTIGVELNVPKNITEYWQRNDLVHYIANPASYRAHSKMPAISFLSNSDISAIVDYIMVMKNKKIKF